MATHSNILAWEIPWTEEPGELQSMWLRSMLSQRVSRIGLRYNHVLCRMNG